jgi:hypothetical protein
VWVWVWVWVFTRLPCTMHAAALQLSSALRLHLHDKGTFVSNKQPLLPNTSHALLGLAAACHVAGQEPCTSHVCYRAACVTCSVLARIWQLERCLRHPTLHYV